MSAPAASPDVAAAPAAGPDEQAALAQTARATYNAAQHHFDAAPLRFWDRFGAKTVARAGFGLGARVLDVCSGTGASALKAARTVGPLGSVTAVDISAGLLGIAREKAARAGLENIRFVERDMRDLDGFGFEEASFDAVLIVFGLFFAEDMEAQVRRLHRLLPAGGVLAVTMWGPHLFEPLYSSFLASVRLRQHGPASDTPEFRPWDRVTTKTALTELMMRAASFSDVKIEEESGYEPIESPEDWWTIIQGTGLRWFIDPLEPAQVKGIRAESLAMARSVKEIETNVLYAIARK